MTPYYQDDWATLYHGDCRDLLPGMTADAVFADPPYGAGVAAWDALSPREWLDLMPAVAPVLAVTPGQRNLLTMPSEVGDLRYRWTLAAVMTNGTSRGDVGFGNWIPVPIWTREGVSLYGPAQDVHLFGNPRSRGLPASIQSDHPSPKPLAIMRWIVGLLPGVSILDPFAGSGTTLVAAKSLGRPSVGIEREERYCALTAARLAQGVLGL